MDEFFVLRAEMEAAIRQDDAARDRYDRFERKWAEREQAKARTEIVHKTFESKPARQQQSAAVMDDESSRAWNEWLNKRVEKYFDLYDEGLTEDLKEAFSKLREEVAQLRGQLEILRAHKVSKDPTKITLVSDAA